MAGQGEDDAMMDAAGAEIDDSIPEATLFEFRAGLMRVTGTTLSADPRRGTVRVRRTSDGLTHFQWLERPDAGALAPLARAAPTPEVDFIVMPGEGAKLERLARPPGARIFKLSFDESGAPSSSSRDLFLWAQEPDASGDESIVESFNRAVNTTVEVVMEGDDDDEEFEDDDDEEEEGPITAEYLSAVLRSLGLPPPPPSSAQPQEQQQPRKKRKPKASAAAGAGAGQVDARSLAAALAAAAARGGAGVSSAAAQQQQQQEALREMLRAAQLGPSLGEILRPDLLLPLLFSGADEEGRGGTDALVERLSQHAPAGHRARGREGVEELASSAQLRSQADAFSSALTSGELDLAHFGLRARGFSVADFLQSVQDGVDAEKEKKEGEGGGSGGGGAA